MIDEEKLEKMLEDNYGTLYAELQKMPVEEFVSKYKDELLGVPGFLDLYNQNVSAPHGLTDDQIDSYFDTDAEKSAYRKYEADYQKQLEEKQKDVEAYDPEYERRRKLVEEYKHDYAFLPPAGDWLANKIADLVISPSTKDAIARGKDDVEIMLRGASDIAAAGLDATPGTGKIATGISYLAGPTIRAINRATSDHDSEFADYAKDYGTNIVLGEGLKGIAGIKDLGPIQRILDRFPLQKWYDIVKSSAGAKIRNLTKPKYGESAEEFLSRIPAAERDLYLDKVSQTIADAQTNVRNFGGSSRNVRKAAETTIEEIHDIAEKENTKNIVKAGLDRAWREANKIKTGVGGTYGGAAKATEEALARKALERADDSKERKQKRDAALDFIINKNERMWNAGFKPHGGIELEAWRKWKGIK